MDGHEGRVAGDTQARYPVICSHGCVASSQPLASQIGIDILKLGGNAADAAVAVAGALNVTEPCSTGIGGDVFCLFYDNREKTVSAINGSGRSPSALTLSRVNQDGFDVLTPIPQTHGHCVTAPGAAAAWIDTVNRFGSGKLSMREILGPAIHLAECGFPVQKHTAHFWKYGGNATFLLDVRNAHGRDMLLNGSPPAAGRIMRMPHLANTFRVLCEQGKSGFYEGRIARSIADVVQRHGGLLSEADLSAHESTFESPIYTDYRGHRVWECAPNGQGITTLMALNLLEGFDVTSFGQNTADCVHIMAECLRLSISDTSWHCSDPTHYQLPVDQLLSKTYAEKRRSLINLTRVMPECSRGALPPGGDTVYFSVVDNHGNACSFINSNFTGFGSGIVPEGCGFTLQNRGLGFSLRPDHPNVVAANKRPMHTIIPSMVTSPVTGDLELSFGIMGGSFQPQGQLQLLVNMIDFGMDPQICLGSPRFLLRSSAEQGDPNSLALWLEEGFPQSLATELRSRGHTVRYPISGYERALLGRGQMISRGAWWDRINHGLLQACDTTPETVYWAGSEPRCDGLAIGY